MKNLKKTLCLVLVIAMVCSLFVSVNAAAFKDQADIDNATAAAVLNELGVITGYTDGSFKPEGVLTRAEGATIIARMLLGDKADEQMAAGNPFDDVKATDWHAGYIAYCVAEGIAAGYGNGKFGPNDTLTVAQFGKMLLNALGYESAREGFTGADWATAVGKYINKLGLAEGANSTLNAACTRQVAAQLALNTLKADLVEYESGSTTIKGGDMEITIGGSKAKTIESTSKYADKIFNEKNDGATKNVLQFAEQYFTNLEYVKADFDFGRPSQMAWQLRGEQLGNDPSTAELLKTYTGSVTRGALFDLVGKQIVEDKDTTYALYIDGYQIATGKTEEATTLFNDTNTYRGTTITATEDKDTIGYYPTGNGVVTEVYLDSEGDDYQVTIVIINTYVATVVSDYDEEDDVLEIKLASRNNHVTLAGTYNLKVEDGYDVADYKEDDFVLVTIDAKEVSTDNELDRKAVISTIAPAKTVSGTIDTYTTSTQDWLNTITVGGKKYSYSKAEAATENYSKDEVGKKIARGSDITLVLDAAGYVITFAEAEASANYLYLMDVKSESIFDTAKQNYVGAVYLTDGSYEEIAVAKINNDPVDLGSKDAEGWYTFTVNAEGKYLLTSVASPAYGGDEIIGNAVYFYGEEAVNEDDPGYAKANAKTVFVVVDEEGESTVFTGYKNMSGVKTTGKLIVDVVVDEQTGFATYVFARTEGGNLTLTGATRDTSTVIYVYRDDTIVGSTDADDNPFTSNAYALVNGVKTTINAEEGKLDAKGLYIDIAYDNVTGYIKSAELVDDSFPVNPIVDGKVESDAFYLNMPTLDISFEGEVLLLNGHDYTVADDCDIILVDGTSYAKIGMSKLTSLKKGSAVVTGVVNAEGQVTALFVDYKK